MNQEVSWRRHIWGYHTEIWRRED